MIKIKHEIKLRKIFMSVASLCVMFVMVGSNFTSAANVATPNVIPAKLSYDVMTGKFSEEYGQILDEHKIIWYLLKEKRFFIHICCIGINEWTKALDLPDDSFFIANNVKLDHDHLILEDQSIRCTKSLKDWLQTEAENLEKQFHSKNISLEVGKRIECFLEGIWYSKDVILCEINIVDSSYQRKLYIPPHKRKLMGIGVQ